MALEFTGGDNDQVNHGSASNLDDVAVGTYLFWIWWDALPSAVRSLLGKSERRIIHSHWGSTGDYTAFIIDGTNKVEFAANIGATAAWYCVAFTWDTSLGSGYGSIYRGSLTGLMASQTLTWETKVAGGTDAGGDLLIGRDSNANTSLDGKIALFAHWGVRLTLDELIQQQYRLMPVVRTDPSELLVFCNYGFSGTGVQRDWSGNSNDGTVTGATVAPHVPLRISRGVGAPYVVGGTTYYSTPAGSLSFAGAPTKQAQVARVGVLTLAGTPSRQTQTSRTGALTSAGAITRQTQTTRTGALTLAGTLTAIKTFLQAVAGVLSLAGTLTRRAGKRLAGVLTSSGAETRETQTTKTGTLTTSGTLIAIRTFLQAVAGVLGLSGEMDALAQKVINGTLTLSGAVAKLIQASLSGGLSLSGVLTAGIVGLVAIALTLRDRGVALSLRARSWALSLRKRESD